MRLFRHVRQTIAVSMGAWSMRRRVAVIERRPVPDRAGGHLVAPSDAVLAWFK
jgi:hypothetical protein